MLIAFGVLLLVAQVPPQHADAPRACRSISSAWCCWSPALPGLGVTKKGATRWLNVGVTIQPTEIMKIAMPLMLAWYFQHREGQLRVLDFLIAPCCSSCRSR